MLKDEYSDLIDAFQANIDSLGVPGFLPNCFGIETPYLSMISIYLTLSTLDFNNYGNKQQHKRYLFVDLIK